MDCPLQAGTYTISIKEPVSYGIPKVCTYSGFTECSNFAYSVRFFHESVAGGRVKQSPQTLQQELAGGKSFKLLQNLWRLLHSTPHHALMEKPNRISKIRTLCTSAVRAIYPWLFEYP